MLSWPSHPHLYERFQRGEPRPLQRVAEPLPRFPVNAEEVEDGQDRRHRFLLRSQNPEDPLAERGSPAELPAGEDTVPPDLLPHAPGGAGGDAVPASDAQRRVDDQRAAIPRSRDRLRGADGLADPAEGAGRRLPPRLDPPLDPDV